MHANTRMLEASPTQCNLDQLITVSVSAYAANDNESYS